MRRATLWAVLVVLIWSAAVWAQEGPKFGVGYSVGMNMPVVQDDQGSGYLMQFRLRWALGKFMVVEPNLALGKYGEPGEVDVDEHTSFSYGIDGSGVTAYGVNATVGGMPGTVGLKPFFLGGIGFYKMSRDDTEDIEESKSRFGWTAGLGLAFGLSSKFDIDVRGQVHVISFEGGTSKKSVSLMAGLNYNLALGY